MVYFKKNGIHNKTQLEKGNVTHKKFAKKKQEIQKLAIEPFKTGHPELGVLVLVSSTETPNVYHCHYCLN